MWPFDYESPGPETGNGGKGSEIDLCDKAIGISYVSWCCQGSVQGCPNLGKWRKGEYRQEERQEAIAAARLEKRNSQERILIENGQEMLPESFEIQL